MIIPVQIGLGLVATTSYACTRTMTGVVVCRGKTRATTLLFIALQQEINRVGSWYGVGGVLSANGEIGISTLAKLIKVAQAIDRKLGARRDSALDDYVHYAISKPTTSSLAREADVVLASLKRDGIQPAGTPIEPYSGTVTPTPIKPPATTTPIKPPTTPTSQPLPTVPVPTSPPIVVSPGLPPMTLPGTQLPTRSVDPTQMYPTAPIGPIASMPTGLKVAGGILLGLGLLGGAIAIAKGLAQR